MLDGLLGRGFSSKSKSLIKLIKARIDMIRRKRNAVQKFLKKDVADLLKNGLDVNAYGRAAGLVIELDISYCYDAMEQFCGLVAGHLSIMRMQSECPEECKEAVATLMFAAARFADLPELRDLRNIFMEKYGNSLDCYVSQEFVKKQAGNSPPLVDTKLQLMQDIAKEFSLKWDRKAFELTLSSEPGSLQEQSQRKRSNDNAHKPQDRTSERDRQDNAGHGRREFPNGVYKGHGGQEENTLHRDNQDTLPHRRWGTTDNGSKPGNGRGNGYLQRDHHQKNYGDEYELENKRVESLHKRGNQETSSYGDQEYISSYGRKPTVQSNHDNSHFDASRQKATPDHGSDKIPAGMDCVKPQVRKVIPPPYVKPNVGKYGAQTAASLPDKSPIDRPIYDRDVTENRTESSQSRFEHNYHEKQVVGSTRSNGRGDEKAQYDQDELVADTKSMPRSVRRRQKLPPPPPNEHMSNAGVDDEIEKRHRRTHRRHEDARRNGLQLALDDDHEQTDEEEKMMDKLLMHYSKKSSKYDAGLPSALKPKAAPSSLDNAADEGHSRHRQNTDGARTNNAGSFSRIRSLPTEPVSSPSEAARLPTRATSFEPDILNQAGHVHPKLPDIDDLTARFKALKGR
ncbi:hypothetical protein Sjap_019883 [Stephania japonica]|uniref:IST1-like protein n=1 Tax=Stephania japonica TaxID=461633 RepID=A0AAP0I064_9MAGN